MAHEIYRTEEGLPPNSLATHQNWPEWAKECVGNLVGLTALKSLARVDRPLYFLGSPFLDDVEPIKSRVSKYTGEEGEYVAEEGPPKITAMSIPEAASMRAIINRFGMSYINNIDEHCWSGWYPYRGSIQPISTAYMINRAIQDPFIRFVAVIDISSIDPANIRNNMHDPDFAIDILAPSLAPALVVPVIGRRDLPPDTLAINGSVTRAEARKVYDWLAHVNGDQELPREVTIESGNERRQLAITRLSQLSISGQE